MPLSQSTERTPAHTREIECRGYRRTDGLWDIEGHLTDVKPRENDDNDDVKLIHDMWLRITIDENFLIHAAEAVMDKSPYPVCPGITPNFSQLAGITIKPGWRREANRRIGGVNGCTHLGELLGPLATVCFQTLYGGGEYASDDASASGDSTDKLNGIPEKPHFIDQCHAHRSDGSIVKKYWPDFFSETTRSC
jgi:hypothetical protein